MTCTNFGPGQGLPGWTQPTLESKPSPVGIDTSTRRVEPQFKATGTGIEGQVIETSGAQSKAFVVLMNEQYWSAGGRMNIPTSEPESRVNAACTTRLQHKPLGSLSQIPSP